MAKSTRTSVIGPEASAREEPQEYPSPSRQMLIRARRHHSLVIGSVMLAMVILMALLSPLIAPYDPALQDLENRFSPPFWSEGGSTEHILGTDNLGRDILSRIMWGSQTSLIIGLLTVVMSGVIGSALGIAAGYFGGRLDMIVTFLVTVRLSLPVVLVALVVVAVLGNSLSLMIAAIGLLLWDRFAIVSRSVTRQLATREYIIAARCFGSSSARVLIRELLPNLYGPLLVVASLEMANAVLLEASLSFLGLGVQPPQVSWGLMVAEAKSQLLFRPWVLAIPSVALIWLVLSINLVGDALRDITTPEGRA